jgi:hypothetical protein
VSFQHACLLIPTQQPTCFVHYLAHRKDACTNRKFPPLPLNDVPNTGNTQHQDEDDADDLSSVEPATKQQKTSSDDSRCTAGGSASAIAAADDDESGK